MEYKINFEELLKSIINNKEIKINDIPSIDLYMDQVTTFMDDGLNSFKRTNKDKILTKTMINNYAKDKVLFSPNKKKYSKRHIIILILIYHLKSILSISDIGKLLHSLNFSMEDEDIFETYEHFLNIHNEEISHFSEDMTKIMDKIKTDLKEDNSDIKLLLFVFVLITKASLEKRLVEKVIDEYFTG